MRNLLITSAIAGLVWWNRYVLFGPPQLTEAQKRANRERQRAHRLALESPQAASLTHPLASKLPSFAPKPLPTRAG